MSKERALHFCDDASGIDSKHAESCERWAKRRLVIGSPWPDKNFFKYAKERTMTDERVDNGNVDVAKLNAAVEIVKLQFLCPSVEAGPVGKLTIIGAYAFLERAFHPEVSVDTQPDAGVT